MSALYWHSSCVCLSHEYKYIAKPKFDACGKQKDSYDIKRSFEDISYHTSLLKRSIRIKDPSSPLGI
jgi:hypothetical protein